jgi:hypothetical protein
MLSFSPQVRLYFDTQQPNPLLRCLDCRPLEQFSCLCFRIEDGRLERQHESPGRSGKLGEEHTSGAAPVLTLELINVVTVVEAKLLHQLGTRVWGLLGLKSPQFSLELTSYGSR